MIPVYCHRYVTSRYYSGGPQTHIGVPMGRVNFEIMMSILEFKKTKIDIIVSKCTLFMLETKKR